MIKREKKILRQMKYPLIRGYFGIREKYSLLTFLFVAVAGFFITLVIVQFQRQISFITESVEKATIAAFYEQANKEAKRQVAALSLELAGPLADEDFRGINELLAKVMLQRDVIRVYLFDLEGRIIADGTQGGDKVGKVLSDEVSTRALRVSDAFFQRQWDIVDAAAPVHIGNSTLGGVRIVFSNKRTKLEIIRQKEFIASIIRGISRNTMIFPIMISISLILIGLYFSSRIAALLVKPIIKLTGVAREIGKGNLTVKVDIDSRDEFGELANSFNQMAWGLAKHEQELGALHDSAKSLTKNLELDVLITSGLNTIREIVKASKGSIMLLKDEYLVVEGVFGWKPGEVVRKRSFSVGEGIAGLAAQRKESILVNDVNNSVYFVKETNKVWRGCQHLLCVPIMHEDVVKGVINIQDKLDNTPFSKIDLEYAEIIASSMAISLSNIGLVQEKIEKTRMEVELKTAEAVQKTLLPRRDPKNEKVEFASFFDHATETGGDWFGYVEDDDSKKIMALIGDVSGHGVSAALITAAVHSFVKTVMLMKDRPGLPQVQQGQANVSASTSDILLAPAQLLTLLSRVVLDIGQRQLVMSFFASVLDYADMSLTFSNAGHNQPYLFRQKIEAQDMAQGIRRDLTVLKATGPRLGDIEAPKFTQESLQLKSGDVLLWFTDGLIECENILKEAFGEKRLEDILKNSVGLSASQIKERIVSSVYQFFGNVPIKDDIAFIVAKIK